MKSLSIFRSFIPLLLPVLSDDRIKFILESLGRQGQPLPAVGPRRGFIIKNLAIFLIAALFFSTLVLIRMDREPVEIDGHRSFLPPDDVLITMRVARHIARDQGPYYNPGQRVAANTSLLHPFLLAPFFRYLPAETGLKVLTHLSWLLVLAAMVPLAQAAGGTWRMAATLFLAIFCPSIQTFAPTAWEQVPQMFLITLGGLALTSRGIGRPDQEATSRRWTLRLGSLSLALAVALRPDSWPLLAAPFWLLLGPDGRRPGDWATAALISTTLLGQIAFHQYFYDDFFPNSYYLKVGFGWTTLTTGGWYLVRNLWSGGNTVFLAAACLCRIAAPQAWSREEKALLASMGLLIGWVVLLGGDVFAQGRFFLGITPLAIHFTVAKAPMPWPINRRPARWFATAAVTVLAGFLAFAVVDYTRQAYLAEPTSGFDTTTRLSPKAAQMALAPIIRGHLKPEDGEVGLFYAGTLGFFLPEYQIRDFLGRADPVIARSPVRWGPIGHNKWDFDYSLSASRVAVIPMFDLPPEAATRMVREREEFAFWGALLLHPRLHADYKYIPARNLGQPAGWGLYVRRNLVDRFAKF